jgi:uncharacterized protein YjbJ (UPF0337 family)
MSNEKPNTATDKPKGTIKEAASRMTDDHKLPADSKMGKTVEQAKSTDTKERGRQAEKQTVRR